MERRVEVVGVVCPDASVDSEGLVGDFAADDVECGEYACCFGFVVGVSGFDGGRDEDSSPFGGAGAGDAAGSGALFSVEVGDDPECGAVGLAHALWCFEECPHFVEVAEFGSSGG